MKRGCLLLLILLLLVFGSSSWGQCPEDPNDRGECDTLNVICLDCEQSPGSGPYLVRFPLLVTHDQIDYIDSIGGFVIPLAWTYSNPSAYCSVLSHNNDLCVGAECDPLPPWVLSIFRHIEDGDTLMHNRMMDLSEKPYPYGPNMEDWDTKILELSQDQAYIHLALVASGSDDHWWWEGDRVLLATLTYKIQDTMYVRMDTTFWPPNNRLKFSRFDGGYYVPRDNLPDSFWIGPPRIRITSPNGGESWEVGTTQEITWLSECFDGANVTIEYSTNSGTNWLLVTNSTPNTGSYFWPIPPTPSVNCRVKVLDADDEDPYDISDADFSITTFVQEEFIRGDADGDSLVGFNDMAYIIGYLVSGCPFPPCLDAADANDDGFVDSGDATYLFNYLFKGDSEPPSPFPTPGPDPTSDDLNCLAECVPLPPDPVDFLIAGDASVCEETEVVVSITAEHSEDLYGYQIFLDYDESILEATSVDISQPPVPDVFEFNIAVDDGEVEIVCIVDCAEVQNIPAGTNELVTITFSVDPDAPPGTTVLDLRNVIAVPFRGNLFTYAGGKTYTNLSDGNFTVIPNVTIGSITDVGNDQGRQVRVNWYRSCYDLAGSPVTITEYSLWRRIDEYKESDGWKYPPGDWDFLKMVPACGELTYNTICPTLADSTAEGIYWSVFFVRAHTEIPTTYYDSDPDSGYSVDNIPPLPIGDFDLDPNSWFTLEWTVPGEYVGEQPISTYDIRYSTTPVGPDTQAWWDDADACAGEGFFNFIVGEEDSFQVAEECGCHPEVYFAIKALDGRPNASQISNIVHFMCGDVSGDEVVDLGDVLYVISYLYKGGPPPEPMVAGDVNHDEIIELGDLLYLISYLYKGGPPPCGS